VNPELPEADQETNRDWILRELRDLLGCDPARTEDVEMNRDEYGVIAGVCFLLACALFAVLVLGAEVWVS
jgi:hypothetical protein